MTATERSIALIRQVVPKEHIIPCDDGELSLRIDGKRFCYYIHRGVQTQVHNKNEYLGSACMQCYDITITQYDRMLAEYLLIKNDEVRYLATANGTSSLLFAIRTQHVSLWRAISKIVAPAFALGILGTLIYLAIHLTP